MCHTTMTRRAPLQALLAIFAAMALANASSAEENVYPSLIRSTAWVVTPFGTGSGVVVDREQRLVATNFHVVGLLSEVKVVFPQLNDGNVVAERKHYAENLDSLAISGTVVRRDPRRDLALVRVARLPEHVAAVKLADRPAVPGQRVHSIGNPGASDALWVYSSGTVRQVYEKRLRMEANILIEARILETQAPLNSGDSGGPVVNDKGELVGIVSAVSRSASLFAFCIDTSELRGLLGGEIKAIDRRVGSALDELKMKYTVNELGNYRLTFAMEDKAEQVVVIESQTELFGKTSIREIFTLALELDKPLAAEQATRLLHENRNRVLGAWELRRENGKDYLVFCARVPANFDAASLDLALRTAAIHSYQMRKSLTASTPRPTPTAAASPAKPEAARGE